MNDPLSRPQVKTARDYLDAARARLAKDPLVQRAADYGLRMLSRVIEEVRGEIDGWEMAELASVYDTLTLLIAEVLDIDAGAAFRALAVLCSDDEALRLTRGQPEPTSEHLRLLRSRVLWITVTYEAGESGAGHSLRIAEIAYKNAAGELRSARSTLELGYEDLPARARERMLASGQPAIRYQLYPAPLNHSATAPAGGHPGSARPGAAQDRTKGN
jgi:hypothetical protein